MQTALYYILFYLRNTHHRREFVMQRQELGFRRSLNSTPGCVLVRVSSGKDRGLHSQTATVNIAVLEWGTFWR